MVKTACMSSQSNRVSAAATVHWCGPGLQPGLTCHKRTSMRISSILRGVRTLLPNVTSTAYGHHRGRWFGTPKS